MKAFFLLICVFIISCGVHPDYLQNKKIQTTAYKEDITVVTKSSLVSSYRTYYWYKSNEIHESKGGYGGHLLHNTYTKYFITNELQEQGKFVFGLKDGEWKEWYQNGQLKSVTNWVKGQRSGGYWFYNDEGELLTRGKYQQDKKKGKWINYVSKDTIVYKQGKPFVKKKKDTTQKESFFKRIFKKREKTEEKNQKTKKEASNKKSQPKEEPVKKREERIVF